MTGERVFFMTGQSPALIHCELLFAVRIPPGLYAALEIPVNMLGFAELVQALLAKLSSHTRHLETAKWASVVVRQRVVDPERSRLDLLKETLGLEWVVRVEIGSQAIGAIVGKSNRLVEVAIGHDGNDRAKSLLAHDGKGVIDIGQHRRLIEVAAFKLRRTPAARQHLRAASLCLLDLPFDFGPIAVADQRPHIRFRLKARPKAQAARIFRNPFDKFGSNGLLNIDTFGRSADLSAISSAAQATPGTATSRSASSATIKASLPPSSRCSFFICGATSCAMR